jgi:hypothetical protein
MNSNEQLLQLKYSLQALAQPVDIQLELFPNFVSIADEMALDLNHWSSVVIQNGLITSKQKALLEQLDALLEQMSSVAMKDNLWSTNALQEREEWATVRNLVTKILQEFSWTPEKPPVARSQYIRSSK